MSSTWRVPFSGSTRPTHRQRTRDGRARSPSAAGRPAGECEGRAARLQVDAVGDVLDARRRSESSGDAPLEVRRHRDDGVGKGEGRLEAVDVVQPHVLDDPRPTRERDRRPRAALGAVEVHDVGTHGVERLEEHRRVPRAARHQAVGGLPCREASRVEQALERGVAAADERDVVAPASASSSSSHAALAPDWYIAGMVTSTDRRRSGSSTRVTRHARAAVAAGRERHASSCARRAAASRAGESSSSSDAAGHSFHADAASASASARSAQPTSSPVRRATASGTSRTESPSLRRRSMACGMVTAPATAPAASATASARALAT